MGKPNPINESGTDTEKALYSIIKQNMPIGTRKVMKNCGEPLYACKQDQQKIGFDNRNVDVVIEKRNFPQLFMEIRGQYVSGSVDSKNLIYALDLEKGRYNDKLFVMLINDEQLYLWSDKIRREMKDSFNKHTNAYMIVTSQVQRFLDIFKQSKTEAELKTILQSKREQLLTTSPHLVERTNHRVQMAKNKQPSKEIQDYGSKLGPF